MQKCTVCQKLRTRVCIIPNTYCSLLGAVNSKAKRGHTGVISELIGLSGINREWSIL